MKKIVTLIVLIFCLQVSFAQNSMIDITGMNVNTPSFFLEYLRDDKSADLFKADLYSGVEGSPFFSPEWTYARIKLADNRKFDSVLIKINLYENKVHFKDEAGREKMIGADVRQIEIKDESSKWNNTFLLSGYGENKNEFFQVITDGKKAGLLKKFNIIIRETKVFNAPNQKSFEQTPSYSIYSAGALYEGNKNCSAIMYAFKNDNKVTKFISANDIKCNKEKDLKKLVEFYNSY